MGRKGGFVETGRNVQKHKRVWRRELVSGKEQKVPHSHVVIKIRRDTLGVSDPSPRPDHTAQSSSARKINPHKF